MKLWTLCDYNLDLIECSLIGALNAAGDIFNSERRTHAFLLNELTSSLKSRRVVFLSLRMIWGEIKRLFFGQNLSGKSNQVLFSPYTCIFLKSSPLNLRHRYSLNFLVNQSVLLGWLHRSKTLELMPMVQTIYFCSTLFSRRFYLFLKKRNHFYFDLIHFCWIIQWIILLRSWAPEEEWGSRVKQLVEYV